MTLQVDNLVQPIKKVPIEHRSEYAKRTGAQVAQSVACGIGASVLTGATAYAILAARKSANPLAKAIGLGSIMFFPVDFLMSAKFAKDNVEFCKKNYFA